jgi:hypothetical protein
MSSLRHGFDRALWFGTERIHRGIGRLVVQIAWLLNRHVVLHGYPIGLPMNSLAEQRIREALDLIAVTWPDYLPRTRAYVGQILICPLKTSLGQWRSAGRQVLLDEDLLCAPPYPVWFGERTADYVSIKLASTIVHELTHARIDAARISYQERRFRIERACVRREIAFVMSLPRDVRRLDLLPELERAHNRAEEVWGTERHAARSVKSLEECGAPSWVVEVHRRYLGWRSDLHVRALGVSCPK